MAIGYDLTSLQLVGNILRFYTITICDGCCEFFLGKFPIPLPGLKVEDLCSGLEKALAHGGFIRVVILELHCTDFTTGTPLGKPGDYVGVLFAGEFGSCSALDALNAAIKAFHVAEPFVAKIGEAVQHVE